MEPNKTFNSIKALPLFISSFNNAYIKLKNNENDFSIIFNNNEMKINDPNLISLSNNLFNNINDLNELLNNIEQSITKIKAFEEIVNNGLSRFDDNKFLSLFNEWVQTHNHFWDKSIIPEIAIIGGNNLLIDKLKDFKNKDEIFSKLTLPEKLNPIQNEEMEFCGIKLLEDENMQDLMLHDHAKKYYWLKNTFDSTSLLPIGYFEEELTKLNKEDAKNNMDQLGKLSDEIKKDKEKIIESNKLDNGVIDLCKKITFLNWLNDFKKKYVLISNHINSVFAHEISARENIEYNDLLYLTQDEILDLLNKNELPKIEDRKKCFVINIKNNEIKKIEGEEAKDFSN